MNPGRSSLSSKFRVFIQFKQLCFGTWLLQPKDNPEDLSITISKLFMLDSWSTALIV